LGSKEKGRKESLILPIYWKSWGVLCLFVQSTELCGFKVQSSKPIGWLSKSNNTPSIPVNFFPSSFLKTYLEQAKDTYLLALYFYHFKKII
jgi:hypothetical protein